MRNHFLRFTGSRTLAGGWLFALLLGWSQLAAQPVLVKDINPGPADSDPAEFTPLKNTLFFAANDGTHNRALWKSDGTAAGTVLVKEVTPDSQGSLFFMRAANDTLFFLVNEATDNFYSEFRFEYWISDGTTAGTVQADEFYGYEMTPYKGDLYYLNGLPPYGDALRRVNATGWTSTVKQLRPVKDYTDTYGGLYFLQEHNGLLYVASGELGDDCCVDYVLWKSDGTTAGTTPIELTLGHRNSGLSGHRFEGQYFYFSIDDRFVDPEITSYHYKTNLVTGETELIGTTPYNPDSETTPAATSGPPARAGERPGAQYAAVVNGTRFFANSDPLHGRELWKEPVAAVATFRINAGGGAYTGPSGKVFAADAYFSGGRRSTPVSESVYNTTDGGLYQDGRYGESFSYNLPTGNGTFDVTLHFNETYWGNLVRTGGAGSRKFNVDVEGQRKLTEYDIYAKARGAMQALTERFRVSVGDGTLNLLFSKGSADLAYVSGIEVTPASGPALDFYRAINLNGNAIALDGYPWGGKTAANYSTNGRGFVNNTTVLRWGTDTVRAAMIRSSVWHWSGLRLNLTAVPTGTYLVYFYNWEDNDPQTFSIALEGKTVLNDYYSGSAGYWAKLGPFSVTVSDGTLNLTSSGGNVNLSGIEVWKLLDAPAAARIAAAGNAERPEAGAVVVYPNPVRDQLTVRLPFPAATVQTTSVTDALGRVQLLNVHQPAGEDGLLIRTGALRKGLYLLTLDTGQESRLVKFIKQ
jgi:ELWxxDGT repeat protein